MLSGNGTAWSELWSEPGWMRKTQCALRFTDGPSRSLTQHFDGLQSHRLAHLAKTADG